MGPEDDEGIRLGARDPLTAIQHLLAVGQYDRAQRMAGDLIAADPENAGAHMVLCQVLLTMEKPEGAEQAAREAVRLDPDNAHVWALIGDVCLQLGRFGEAEEAILRALEIDADDAHYHFEYGRLLAINGRKAAALSAIEHSLALDPDAHHVHALRAALLLQVHPKKWSISIEAAERSLRLDPENSFAHAVLGMIRLHKGDRPQAEERFRSALQLNPGSQLALQGLAQVVMAKNPLYRPLLAFNLVLTRHGPAGALGIIFGLWAIESALVRALSSNPATAGLAEPVRLLYYAFCAYTWFATPITHWILRRHHPWLADVKTY